MDFTIPISYKNIPAGVVLKDSFPSEINIKIQDKGAVLLNYYAGKKNDPLNINLKSISTKKDSYTISKTALETEISKHLASSTTLLAYSPNALTIYYTSLQEKEVPVRFDGDLIPASGYMIFDTIHSKPSVIKIFGTKEKLDSIDAVFTEHTTVKDIDKPFKKRIKLLAPPNVRLSDESVVLLVDAGAYTEKSFTLPVVCLNIPPEYNVRLFPSNVEVICQIALTRYPELKDADFEASVDYKDLIQQKSHVVPVLIQKKPDWLKTYRVSPEKIEFLIERKVN